MTVGQIDNSTSGLFIVKSPLQAINAAEARVRFNVNHAALVIRHSASEINNRQVEAVARLFEWDEVHSLRPMHPRLRLAKDFQFLHLKRRGHVEMAYIFSSELNNIFVRSLPHRRHVLFDDGTATLRMQEEELNPSRFAEISARRARFSARRVVERLLGIGDDIVDNPILFSCFDLAPHPGQDIVRNDYRYIKSRIDSKCTTADTAVYFIGSNFISQRALTPEFYVSAVRRVRRFYGDSRFIYIPHRRETEDDLRGLRSIPGLEVERFTYPMEVEFMVRGVRPTIVSSFYSTALYTLKQIYDLQRVDSFLLPLEELRFGRESAAIFYEFYKKKLQHAGYPGLRPRLSTLLDVILARRPR